MLDGLRAAWAMRLRSLRCAVADRFRNPRRYLVLPACLILLEFLYDLLLYKAEVVRNVYLRVGVILAVMACGFSLVGVTVAPRIERWMDKAFSAAGSVAGWLGTVLVALAVFAGLYYLELQVHVYGIEAFVPESWHNARVVDRDKPDHWMKKYEELKRQVERELR